MDPRSSITVVRLKERQFLIPTEVLRRCCPTLRRQLPSTNTTITHLELSGISEATFETLVYYFRTGRAPELNIQNVIDIYCTASDLGIRPLEKKCWKHVFKTMSRQEQTLLLLVESERGVHMTRDDTLRLMDVLVKNFRKTVNSAAFLQLSERQVRHLLTYPPLRDEYGINATYKAAMRWLHADCRARHGYVERLTSALGETPDETVAEKLTICPTIAREVPKVPQKVSSPSPHKPKSATVNSPEVPKVSIKQGSNLEGNREVSKEVIEETKSGQQTQSSNLHPREKSPDRFDDRPMKASSPQRGNEMRGSKISCKEERTLPQVDGANPEQDLGIKGRGSRIAGLVGGRTGTEMNSEPAVFNKYQQDECKTLSRRMRSRAVPRQLPSAKLRHRNWQRHSGGDQRGDSSLTDAEREPSKMRRSLNKMRIKSKMSRQKQRTARVNQANFTDQRETDRQFRMADIRHTEDVHKKDADAFYPASSGDMEREKLGMRPKFRRRCDQSETLNQTARFNEGERNAKRILCGGRFNRTKTAVVTRVSFDKLMVAPDKMNKTTATGHYRRISNEKKVRITKPPGVGPPVKSKVTRRTGHYVLIEDPQNRTNGRQSRQRSTKPNSFNRFEGSSRRRTKKKSRYLTDLRATRPTNNGSGLNTRFRRCRSETEAIPGKRDKKGKCVVC